MMTPVGRLVVVRLVPKHELVSALAWLVLPAMIGPLIGPPLGGFITTYFSWRWIFWINIPIGILGIALAIRYIENVHEQNVPPLDFKGFVLSGVGLAGLAFGLTTIGQHFMPTSLSLAMFLIGGLSTFAYVLHARVTPFPNSGFESALDPDVSRECHRRVAVSHRHRRAAVFAAADVSDRIRHEPAAVGPADVRRRHRRDDDARERCSPFCGGSASSGCCSSTR